MIFDDKPQVFLPLLLDFHQLIYFAINLVGVVFPLLFIRTAFDFDLPYQQQFAFQLRLFKDQIFAILLSLFELNLIDLGIVFPELEFLLYFQIFLLLPHELVIHVAELFEHLLILLYFVFVHH
jgi:hypothetical protein